MLSSWDDHAHSSIGIRARQTFLSHGVALQNGFSLYHGQRIDELRVCVADGRDRLCTGLDEDRLVFEHLQLVTIWNSEGRDQASYPDKFEGIDPEFYSYQRWKKYMM